MSYIGKTENFFTRNSKMIAFLVTIGVFLAIFGPILFFEAQDYYAKPEEDDRPVMTENDLILLRDQGYILVSQLTHFASTEDTSELLPGKRSIRVELAGGRYLIMALASEAGDRVEECYLYDLNGNADDSYDVFKINLRAFFNK